MADDIAPAFELLSFEPPDTKLTRTCSQCRTGVPAATCLSHVGQHIIRSQRGVKEDVPPGGQKVCSCPCSTLRSQRSLCSSSSCPMTPVASVADPRRAPSPSPQRIMSSTSRPTAPTHTTVSTTQQTRPRTKTPPRTSPLCAHYARPTVSKQHSLRFGNTTCLTTSGLATPRTPYPDGLRSPAFTA
jgi:hypothetical protein